MKELFEQFTDVRELCAHIEMMVGEKITAGQTLLFLDEIQACETTIKSYAVPR